MVPVPEEYLPPGKVIIATQEARDLAAYLIGLNHTYPLEGEE